LVTITAGAGTNEKNFLIHKKFARHYSPIFATAFESKFIEGQTQTYKLDDVAGTVVQLLIQWLYTKRFDPDFDPHANPEDLNTAYESVIHLAVQTWALADRLILPALQNQVVNWIYWCRQEVDIVPIFAFNEVYELTGPGSALRSLFVSFCARFMPCGRYLEEPDRFPPEMMLELASYFAGNCFLKEELEEAENFHVDVIDL
jgi:hypothetical protein